MQYVWPLRRDAQTVGHARVIIREELSGLDLHSELIDDAVLMLSELITNAFMYGEGPYEMVLHVDNKEIRCVVVDSGPPLPDPSPPDIGAEHGRGARILSARRPGSPCRAGADPATWCRSAPERKPVCLARLTRRA
jgi:anti-sigma regulatory factor (Ser/Thr protein kinase)